MAHTKYSADTVQRARQLRRNGKSLLEIAREMRVSKSTVRNWVKEVEITDPKVKEHLYRKQILIMKDGVSGSRQRSIEMRKRIEDEAIETYNCYSDRTLLVAGAMLYWAEGDKTKHTSFTNSDQHMIKFMVRWFRDVCRVADTELELRLHIHDAASETRAKQFWSECTNLPLRNFTKTYEKPIIYSNRANHLSNGILRVRVSGTGSTLLRNKILMWSELYINQSALSSVGRAAAS